MQKHTLLSVAFVSVTSSSCACGGGAGINASGTADEVDVTENVAGDTQSDTSIDDVNVKEADVDARSENAFDTDVHNEVDGNTIAINIDFGGDDAGDDNDDAGGSNDGGSDDGGGNGGGGVNAAGDGVAFDFAYHGPVDDHADITPSASAELGIDSVEWIVRAVTFDEPTFFDDDAGFEWGDPNDGGEYVLAARFGDEALAAFTWDTASTFCDGADASDACHGRAISAACSAEVVMRAWLIDGTTREAVAQHTSERPTCW